MGFYTVNYPVLGNPLVSVLLWGCADTKDFEKQSANLRKTSWKNLEILQGKDRETVEKARGEYLLFLVKGAVPVENDWLEKLLGICQGEETGIAGAKLTIRRSAFSGDKIFHAGMVLGAGKEKIAANVYEGLGAVYSGYMHRASLQMDYSAVSGCCMLVKKNVCEKAGGLNPELSMPYQAVDFCLRVRELGYLAAYEPGARLRLTGKISDWMDETETAKKQKDAAYMKTRWGGVLDAGDPCYNPAFSLEKADYRMLSP
jgi:hypothetical protein